MKKIKLIKIIRGAQKAIFLGFIYNMDRNKDNFIKWRC